MHKQNKNTLFLTTAKRLRQHGFTLHAGLGVLIVVAIAGIGVYTLHKSSAATLPPGKVYRLPAAAPRPSTLPPQPVVVSTVANPVVKAIPDAVWKTMIGKSWHSGCPVGRSQLSYMQVNYWGFDGYVHRGEIIFRSTKKTAFVNAFTKLFNAKIPIRAMYLVDRFGYSPLTNGADDYASMQHDNTSAFNCRWVDGSPGVTSPHSYGTAVDINTFENPYKSAKGWVPNSWWATHKVLPYAWRSSSDPAVQMMTTSGFSWSYGTSDAQHFDAR